MTSIYSYVEAPISALMPEYLLSRFGVAQTKLVSYLLPESLKQTKIAI